MSSAVAYPRVVSSDLFYFCFTHLHWGNVIRYHHVKFQLYTDDIQVYLTFELSPDSSEMAKAMIKACGGGVRFCSDAVLRYFWCGFAVFVLW